MPIEIFNPVELAHEDKGRSKVLQTNRIHAVVLYYGIPGERDEMHCHDQDQTFYSIEGECTLHFPDGGHEVLKPGMLAAITGGSFYQLENSGDGPMVLPAQPLRRPRQENRLRDQKSGHGAQAHGSVGRVTPPPSATTLVPLRRAVP